MSGFDTTRLGVHVKPEAAAAVHVGTFALEDCADICRDRDDCLAFSSCLVTNECVLSTERTPSADTVETQTACSIFSSESAARLSCDVCSLGIPYRCEFPHQSNGRTKIGAVCTSGAKLKKHHSWKPVSLRPACKPGRRRLIPCVAR